MSPLHDKKEETIMKPIVIITIGNHTATLYHDVIGGEPAIGILYDDEPGEWFQSERRGYAAKLAYKMATSWIRYLNWID